MFARVLIAGVVAGVVAFFWGAVAHMVFQLGDSAVQDMPQEELIVDQLRTHLTESGVYFFPGLQAPDGATEAQRAELQEKQMEKIDEGPAGFLFYQINPPPAMSAIYFIRQGLFDLGLGLIAAYLCFRAAPSIPNYFERVLLVTLLGVFASLAVVLPHWNWYGFATDWTIGGVIEQVVGAFLIGLVVAAIVRPTGGEGER
jgi:hypothetical protein